MMLFLLYHLGWNYYGQLGQGDTDNRGDGPNEMGNNLEFVDLGTDFAVQDVACGGYHTCVLSTSRDMKCFGRNGNGKSVTEPTFEWCLQ